MDNPKHYMLLTNGGGWENVNSRERLLTAISGGKPDHVPFYCWCFGFAPPSRLRWHRAGREVAHWYSMRLEHIHTLPQPWTVEDDFERVRRWLGLGLDDVLEVSVPWSMHPEVRIRDWQEPPDASEPYTRLCREYETPAGKLRHIVRRTDEEVMPGWVIQPRQVPLIEDFNIPRGVRHAVVGPEDLPKLRYLLQGPTSEQLAAYRERMALVKRFAAEQGLLVQGWSAFGMDGVIWLMGVEGAVMAAMTEPEFFQDVIDLVYQWDRRRTEVLLDVGGVDLVVQRGWYSSTDFWSPATFRRFVLPHLKDLVNLAHQSGVRYGYTMTTGTLAMADLLLESGIDLLYYVDPVTERADLAAIRDRFAGRLAIAGGVSSGVTLAGGVREEIRREVETAVHTFGQRGGFILAPVDGLFPDTPWSSVEAMIGAWREVCGMA